MYYIYEHGIGVCEGKERRKCEIWHISKYHPLVFRVVINRESFYVEKYKFSKYFTIFVILSTYRIVLCNGSIFFHWTLILQFMHEGGTMTTGYYYCEFLGCGTGGWWW